MSLIAIAALAALIPVAAVATNLGLLAATTAVIVVAAMSLTMRHGIAVAASGAREGEGTDEVRSRLEHHSRADRVGSWVLARRVGVGRGGDAVTWRRPRRHRADTAWSRVGRCG